METVLVIITVAALIFGAYYWWKHHKLSVTVQTLKDPVKAPVTYTSSPTASPVVTSTGAVGVSGNTVTK